MDMFFYIDIWNEDGSVEHTGIVSNIYHLTLLAMGRQLTIRTGATKEEFWADENRSTRDCTIPKDLTPS